jgi:hypothetical protein
VSCVRVYGLISLLPREGCSYFTRRSGSERILGTSMVKFGKIQFLEKNVTCERNSAAILKILSIYDSQDVLVCNETIFF